MHHLILPRRETGAVTGLLDSGLCTQTGYHQGNQVPGSPPVTLCVLVLRGGNSRELIEPRNKELLLSHLALRDPAAPWPHCSLPKISFLYSFSKGGLWLTLATDPEAWWLVYNSQSADPAKPSLEFCLFLPNQIHKSKSPKNMTGSPLFKAFKAPRSFFSIKEGTHPLNPG